MSRFLTASPLVAALLLSCVSTASSQEAWNGLYYGGKISYSFGDKDIVGDRFTYNQNTNPVIVNHDYEGLGVFGFLGQNWRDGDVVFGIEAALGYTNSSSDLIFNPDNDYDQIDIGWTGELVARIGSISGSSMIYLKGGVSAAEIRNTGGDTNAAGPDLNDRYLDESVFFGPIGGIGIETVLDSGVLLRLDATIADYGDFAQTNNQNQTYRVSNGQVTSTSLGVVIPF